MNRDRRFRIPRQERTVDDMKRQAAARGGDYDNWVKNGVKIYKIHDGKNIVRILPPSWKDNETNHFGYPMALNYDIGPDKQRYLSRKVMLKEPDPIDEARREAESSGDKDLANALKPRYRVLYYIIDRFNEDDGVQLWDAPFTVNRDLCNLCIDEDTNEVLKIDDEYEGNDFRFYKEGKGLNTEYNPSKMKLLKSTPISDDSKLMESWLQHVIDNPIPDTLIFYSYDHIASVFNGQSAPRNDNDDNDDTEVSRTSSVRKSSESRTVHHRVSDDDADYKERSAPRGRVLADASDQDDDDTSSSRRGSKRQTYDEESPSARRGAKQDDDIDDDKWSAPPPKRSRSKEPADDDDDRKAAPRGGKRQSRDSIEDDEPDLPFDEDEQAPAKRTPVKSGRRPADDERSSKGSVGSRIRERIGAQKRGSD